MKKSGALKADPTAIGSVAEPPFARLPDPGSLFSARAARFRALAEGHDLAAYLRLLADICDIQHATQAELPALPAPSGETLDRAEKYAMPPLDRSAFRPDADFAAFLDRFLTMVDGVSMPEPARLALDRVRRADSEACDAMVAHLLSDSIPVEALAEHIFVAAALQVQFARMAAGLDARRLKPVGDGVCPSCGGPPATSLVVGWVSAEGTRFCSCATCATLWNYVRVKCAVCGSTDKISFRELDGGDGAVKAEICGNCRSYVKILHQHKKPALDPIADDVATLGLDILVKELGFARGGTNPFLIGY